MDSGNSGTKPTHNKEQLYGIPCGNTIAVVGDPGTGKTTLLLNYLSHGSIMFGKIKREGKPPERSSILSLHSLPSQKEKETEETEETFETLNKLFIPSGRPKKDESASKKPLKTLRCFISLENNLDRVWKNHKSLISPWNGNGSEDSQYIFIDATAFLSGRLEDKLRYPRLNGGNKSDKIKIPWDDQIYDFTLGGHHLDEDEHFGLYFQKGDHEPKRIEQLEANTKERVKYPFNTDKHVRAFNLITRPIPDPFKRVRLLKDLLAELFVRFPGFNKRILAIDSLSALMNPFEEGIPSGPGTSARRLHILNLVRWLEEYNVTTFMACEAEHDTVKTWGGHPLFLGEEERYLASGVIQLHYHNYPSGDVVRYLRVMKMRGAAHDMRPFAYGLGEEGVAWVEDLFGEAGNMR